MCLVGTGTVTTKYLRSEEGWKWGMVEQISSVAQTGNHREGERLFSSTVHAGSSVVTLSVT